ncbi:hypothetical protein Bca4012_052307 [Brassica carinata]
MNAGGMLNTCKSDGKWCFQWRTASANSVPAAAVIQRMQALSGMIGRKASVGGFLSPPSNPRAQPWTGGETTKLEFGRGSGNFRWSGEMRRDRKEHQRRKHSAETTLTLRDESKGRELDKIPQKT